MSVSHADLFIGSVDRKKPRSSRFPKDLENSSGSFERFIELFFEKLFMTVDQIVMGEFIDTDRHHGDKAFLQKRHIAVMRLIMVFPFAAEPEIRRSFGRMDPFIGAVDPKSLSLAGRRINTGRAGWLTLFSSHSGRL